MSNGQQTKCKKSFFVLTAGVCVCLVSMISAYCLASEALLQRAEGYQKYGRYLESLSFLRDVSINPVQESLEPKLWQAMGDLYFQYLQDSQKALVYYQKFIDKFPAHAQAPSVFHRAAKINYIQGDRQEAVSLYRHIFSAFPQYYKDNEMASELKAMEAGDRLFEEIIFSIERPLPRTVRVLIIEDAETLSLGSGKRFEAVSAASAFSKEFQGGDQLTFTVGDQDTLYVTGQGALKEPVVIRSGQGDVPVTVDGVSHRGSIWVYTRGGKLMAVCHLDIEQYLYGVIPREVSPRWHKEVLQAQAIAARTYALYHMIKRENRVYDLYSTVSSQVYGGKDVEARATRKAVDETQGKILTFNGRVALTLYHANSGGSTETPENVWGGGVAYLVSVADEFSKKGFGASWRVELCADDIADRLHRFGFSVVPPLRIMITDRSETGRIRTLSLVHNGSETLNLTGNSFRLMVGSTRVRSTNFEVVHSGDRLEFQGRGYGHGVGMSQWGAKAMADQGHRFEEILKFYYPETEIKTVNLL